MKDKERIAIVPGSFDPITNGHISIIEKAAEQYDKVFVAVMINPEKEYMFSIEQRRAIAQAAIGRIENVTVISYEGWLWELAKQLGACAIVKGYRNQTDFEYEQKMAIFNKEHCPDAQTVLIKSDDALSQISSTAVRKLILENKSLDNLLPKKAIDAIEQMKKKTE